MKKATYAEYVKMILDLIYFVEKIEYLPKCETDKVKEVINILKFWSQFEDPRKQTKKREK